MRRTPEEGRHCRDKGDFIFAVLPESSNGRRASIRINSPFVTPAVGVRFASHWPCRLRIIRVLDPGRMAKTSTGHGIRKTRCCIGRSRTIWKRFSLTSKNAAERFRIMRRRLAVWKPRKGDLILETCRLICLSLGMSGPSLAQS